MNKETIKVTLAVLRVFVDAANRGNDITLHAHEITNLVCKELHRRKEKEKKNTHSHVIAVLRALKSKRILFEAIDNWDDDKLKRFKPVESRRTFGLTAPALEYLTSVRARPDYSTKSETVLTDMLEEFDVIPSRPRVATVPAVLVETITAIEQKEHKMADVIENRQSEDHNEKRIASEVRNIKFLSEYTPAKLLGALRAVSAFTAETATYAAVIGWAPHKIQNASTELYSRGLVTWRNETPVHARGRSPSTKRTGIYLTDLGKRVAEAGNFHDVLPADQRWSYTPPKPYSHYARGNMLKGSKKTMTESVTSQSQEGDDEVFAGRIPCRMPDGKILYFANPREAAEFFAAKTPTAPDEIARGKKSLGLYETIMGFVVDTSRAMAASIERMRVAKLPDGTAAEEVNPLYLSHAVAKVTEVLTDLRYELSEIILAAERGTAGAEIDMKRLQDYFAGIELAAEEILTGGKRVIPSLRPHAKSPIPRIVKLHPSKNIVPEYVGPAPGRPVIPADKVEADTE